MWERTRLRLPGARGEVWTEAGGDEGGLVNYAPDEGSLVRIESRSSKGEVRAFLRPGAGRWVESVCPSGEGEYVWTRKRADIPVQCDVRIGERRWQVEARGMEDESAGYHPRHTVWSWSAGVGRTRRRALGRLEPGQRHQRPAGALRAGDLGGRRALRARSGRASRAWTRSPSTTEPGSSSTVSASGEGSRTSWSSATRYRQPFGSFSGTLPGGLELERGLGVMEHHDAHW